MTLITDLLQISNLRKRVKQLETENKQLKEEISKKQAQINKTNAYYKGVLRKYDSKKKVVQS
jgi:predicted RNase H-like nuclease (RuvC/YqgF family)